MLITSNAWHELIYKTFDKKEEKTMSFKIYFHARYLPGDNK